MENTNEDFIAKSLTDLEPNRIERLHISNFKSIKEVDIALSNLNILIGGNGAGKSNFISFFKLIRAITEGNLQDFINNDIDALLHFGRKSKFLTGALIFGNTKTNHKNAIDFIVQAKGNNGFLKSLNDRYNRGKGDDFEENTMVNWDTKLIDQNVEESTLRDRKNDYRVNYVFKYLSGFKVYHFHDTTATSPLRAACHVNDNRSLAHDGANLPAYLYFLQLKRPLVFKRIEGTIRLIAPYFDRFDLEPNRSNDKIELRWREKGADPDAYFNAQHLSDGTLRFMALTTLLRQDTEDLPKTIIIDEPELGLHPTAIAQLAGLLEVASRQCQVIVSTQSVELISQFEPEDIIAVDRENRTAGSTFRRFTRTELASWLEDYSMGELWEKNLIGGNP